MSQIKHHHLILSALALLSAQPVCAQESETESTTLVVNKPVEREIALGETHLYSVALSAGQYTHAVVEQTSADVVVTLFDPAGSQISQIDANGAGALEEAGFVAETSGVHQLEIRMFDDLVSKPEPGTYSVTLDELLSHEEYQVRLDAQRERREAAIEWISDTAIRLKTVEAGHGFEDLQPLKAIIGDARIVALGEATHGTREFFQLKHRMLEFLVSEMGFNVFAIEATMPEGFDVNEYVLTGQGDPGKALSGLYFWTWNTEEVLDMIRWMREHNERSGPGNQVKFYGFDMQFPGRAARIVLDYLARVDSVFAQPARTTLRLLANPYVWERSILAPDSDQTKLARSLVQSILASLNENRSEYIAKTGRDAWALAQLNSQILVQNLSERDDENWSPGNRDKAMAANVRWILKHEGPGSKAVLWAHNFHVSRASLGQGLDSMGLHLDKIYGPEMVVFGLMFNQGSFRARPMAYRAGAGLRTFTVPAAPEDSLDNALATAGLSVAALNLGKVPANGPVAEWFADDRPTRSIGANFAEDLAPSIEKSVHRYDALLFVETTTAARGNPGGQRPTINPSTPSNLDLEQTQNGTPVGWIEPPSNRDSDFQVTSTNEQPYEGRLSALIRRDPGKHYGEYYGSIYQLIEAAPYQGKRIRLQAAVRTDLQQPDSEAYLWLRAALPGQPLRNIATPEGAPENAITTREWKQFEIVGEVAPEAEAIDFGLALVGTGRAWIDDVRLEVID